jgi:hypothetical protein
VARHLQRLGGVDGAIFFIALHFDYPSHMFEDVWNTVVYLFVFNCSQLVSNASLALAAFPLATNAASSDRIAMSWSAESVLYGLCLI